ncbi:MAG: hypothetical protein M1375_04880 [Candidatus Thermoplasmatota archaeon]|jgi:hypothetical protein|nr:hypothetical protein [Candidatus Thermoplasmatota archaeon]MCL5791287.1 hypothetical protein [Candidatus Thermoplasmatota archaeon]
MDNEAESYRKFKNLVHVMLGLLVLQLIFGVLVQMFTINPTQVSATYKSMNVEKAFYFVFVQGGIEMLLHGALAVILVLFSIYILFMAKDKGLIFVMLSGFAFLSLIGASISGMFLVEQDISDASLSIGMLASFIFCLVVYVIMMISAKNYKKTQ